jgi:hypothetical protein
MGIELMRGHVEVNGPECQICACRDYQVDLQELVHLLLSYLPR